MSDPYHFRRATLDDLPLLSDWHKRSHVRQWWDAGEPYDQSDLSDERVARWIVSHKQQPFAYMQDYAVHGWGNHHFAHLPASSRGIDQFIGVPSMIGQGHGSNFIAKRMKALFDDGVPSIATDPHPENQIAIRV